MQSAGWGKLFVWQIDRRSATPLVRQIYLQVRTAVLGGALGPGAELPSSRAMASMLGVARACVVGAYEQLAAEGIVESRLGSGTFVSNDLRGFVDGSARRVRARAIKPRPIPLAAKAFPDFERSAAVAEGRPFNTGRTLVDAR